MTIKMETMSELPDIKAEVLPDEFGLNGAGGHNVTSAEARGHDMTHRSVLIIYDQQFIRA